MTSEPANVADRADQVDRSEPAIVADRIDKAFGARRAVRGASVTVPSGAMVAVLGPSGSGKTTLLRVVAGFEVPDSGSVTIAGTPVVGARVWVEPEHRRVGMVFQDGALFPHLTVSGNVAFGKPRPGRVEEMLTVVGLAERAGAFPHELSGGERQRVALARAMATDPAVMLLDEPFASLDAGLRSSLRAEVASILRTAGASALLVTHDQQEALSLADSVVVMRDGVVMQTGTPEEIYARPASRWVAAFLGTVDVLPGTARCGVVTCELGRLPADGEPEGDVEVLVRPEVVSIARLADGAPEADAAVVATVVGRDFYGADQLVTVRLPSGRLLRSRRAGFGTWEVGATVAVAIDGPVRTLPIDGA